MNRQDFQEVLVIIGMLYRLLLLLILERQEEQMQVVMRLFYMRLQVSKVIQNLVPMILIQVQMVHLFTQDLDLPGL